MIFDKIENAALYYGLGENFRKALEWLAAADPAALTPGERVEIDGDRVYATMFQVDTLPAGEGKLENHHNYADIQYVYRGREKLGYLLDGPAEALGGYDGEKDIQFFSGDWDTMTVPEGTFYIVWPHDLHSPRLADGPVSPVVRLVAKVKL